MQVALDTQADAPAVLSKATVRAADLLHLNNASLARIIAVSEPTITRMRAGHGIDPATKEGQQALLQIRVFRSLDPLVGGDEAKRVFPGCTATTRRCKACPPSWSKTPRD